MDIKHRLERDVLYICPYGELDECSAASARGYIDKIIDESTALRSVVFDFSNLSFMDSTGIGVLLGRYKKLKRNGVRSFVSSPSFAVNKILQISGLYDVMPKIN